MVVQLVRAVLNFIGHVNKAKQTMDITLYWGSGSFPCWRVMLTLEEKGLAYNSKMISFDKKEQKSDEIMALNPRGQVPTMVIKGGSDAEPVVINESIAACEYLEAMYPDKGTRLLPKADTNPEDLARILQIAHETCNLQQKAIKDILYYKWFTPADNVDEALLQKRYKILSEELKIWEGFLKTRGEPGKVYLASNSMSMADIMFFPYLAFFVRLGLKLDHDRFVCLAGYYEFLKERDGVKKSWPPHWSSGPSPDQPLANV